MGENLLKLKLMDVKVRENRLRKTVFTSSPKAMSPRTTGVWTSIATPPRTASPSLASSSLSPRLLLSPDHRRYFETEVLSRLHQQPRFSKLEKAILSIEALSCLRLSEKRKRGQRVERKEDRPVMLEVLEAKWAQFPKEWTIERRVLECTLSPPSYLPSLEDPVPKPLIETLSRSPLGVEVLKEALSDMPRARLYRCCNYANITTSLKERSLSQSRAFKRLRIQRANGDTERNEAGESSS